MRVRGIRLLGLLSILLSSTSYGATSSPLFSRGYTVIPAPQKVSLGTKDFEVTRAWRLELGTGVKPDDIAVQSLKEAIAGAFRINAGRIRDCAGSGAFSRSSERGNHRHCARMRTRRLWQNKRTGWSWLPIA